MPLTSYEQNWMTKFSPVGMKLYECQNGPLYLRGNLSGIEMIEHTVEAALPAKAQLLLWKITVWG